MKQAEKALELGGSAPQLSCNSDQPEEASGQAIQSILQQLKRLDDEKFDAPQDQLYKTGTSDSDNTRNKVLETEEQRNKR